MHNENTLEEQQLKLPFDIRTVLRGILKRWRILAGAVVVSATLGILGGLLLGNRAYEAETVLLYRPGVSLEDEETASPTLLTQMNMVKIQANLEATRQKLQLPSTLESLGAATSVRVQRDTDLLIIKARWDDREQSAQIANTLRDSFLETQKSIRRDQYGSQIQDLRQRLAEINRELRLADQALQDFTTENGVVDLDKEAQWYLDQITALEILYEQSQIEKRSTQLQMANLDRIVSDLKTRVAEESDDQGEDLASANIRVRRLLDTIDEDKEQRANKAILVEKETKFRQMNTLHAQGLISDFEFERARAEMEAQKARTVDTAQIEGWREEVERLDKTVIPSKSGATPSARLLQEMRLKSFNIQLDSLAVGEKVSQLEEAISRVRAKLDNLPALQRRFVELNREVTSRNAERERIETLIAKAQRSYESDATDYQLVSEATVPVLPVQSNRRLLALAISILGISGGFCLVLALEITDTRVKSSSEVSAKLDLPLLGSLPELPFNRDPLVTETSPQFFKEPFRVIARSIRNAVPHRGAKVLFVSAQHLEGATSVVTNLALCFGRQGEHVLAVDSQIRRHPGVEGLTQRLGGKLDGIGDLADYLGAADSVLSTHRAPGCHGNISCIPFSRKTVDPDSLMSSRMAALLEESSREADIVLVDAPPLLHYVDAQALASSCDGAILVVRNRGCSLSELRKALGRLESTGVPVLGVVLNRVEDVDSEVC